MNEHDIVMLAVGALAGSILTGVAGYIYVNRKYTPLHELEDRINELEWRKRELETQSDYVKNVIDTQTKEHKEEIAKLEDEQESLKNNIESLKYASPEDLSLDEGLEDLQEDVRPKKQTDYFEPTGRYVINSGNPRWDGPLTDKEQEEFDDCNGDADMEHTVLDDIRRTRYKNSIDDNDFMYQITEEEHQDAPDWFDQITLDYYEGDDIFSEGKMLVDNIAGIIDVRVLNHFAPNGTVWCRNEKLECDYEIIYHTGSWQNAVYHIPEEEAAPVRKFNKELADRLEE